MEIILPKHDYAPGETVRGRMLVTKQILLKDKTAQFGVRGYTRTKTRSSGYSGAGRHRRHTSHITYHNKVFFEKSLISFLPKIEDTTTEKKGAGFTIFKNPFDLKKPFELKNPFESKPDVAANEILDCAFEFIIPTTAKSSTDDYPQVIYEINFNANISFFRNESADLDFTVTNLSGKPVHTTLTKEPIEAKCFKCNRTIQIKNPKMTNTEKSLVEGTCPICNSYVQRLMS